MTYERSGASGRAGRQRGLSAGSGPRGGSHIRGCGRSGVWRCCRRGIRRRRATRLSVAQAFPLPGTASRRRTGRWHALLLRLHLRLDGRRGIGRRRRFWRSRWGRGGRGSRRHGTRWRGRRGRSVWRLCRRRSGALRRGRRGRSGSRCRSCGRRRRRCGPGRRCGRRCGALRGGCCGRCRVRWGWRAFRRRSLWWSALRGLLGFSIGTEFRVRLRLRHHQRCGLRVRWRAHELHRRQSCRGKQHEPKFCHDDFGSPENIWQEGTAIHK